MGILHKITQLMLDLLKAPFLVLHFFFYTVILLSILLIPLSTLSMIRHLTYGNNYIWLLSLNLIYETVDWARKWLVDFSAGKTQLVSFDHSYSIGAIDVKMDWSAHEKKSSFKMLKLSFSSKLDWGSYIISIAKTASKKLEPWFALSNLFLLRLLCISINLPYDHAWNIVVMSGLVLLLATWNCWIRYKNGYAGLLALLLLPFLNSWLIVKM